MDSKNEHAGDTQMDDTAENEAQESSEATQLEQPTETEVDETARRESIAEAIQSGKAITGRPTIEVLPQEDSTKSDAPVPVMKTKRVKKKLLYIAGGVFGVIVLVFVIGLISKADRVGKLVEAQAAGIEFERPESWIEKKSEDGFTYYTERGDDIQNAEMAVVLGAQTSPVEYATLSEEDKSHVKGALSASPQALSESFVSKDCAEPGEVKNNEQQREGYDLAYFIEASCNRLEGRDVKSVVKIVFGWKGKSLHIFAVMADEKVWQDHQEKLDQILASAKPL